MSNVVHKLSNRWWQKGRSQMMGILLETRSCGGSSIYPLSSSPLNDTQVPGGGSWGHAVSRKPGRLGIGSNSCPCDRIPQKPQSWYRNCMGPGTSARRVCQALFSMRGAPAYIHFATAEENGERLKRFRLIDYTAANHSKQHLRLSDFAGINIEEVLRDDDQVGKLSRLK